MTDDRFDERLRQAAQEYHRPPATPREELWTRIQAERARRRAAQIEARGEQADPAQLRREVEERDRRDSQRSVAPMRAADDATVIDTNQLDLEAVVGEVLRHIREQS